jgi:hypothetical protein
MIIIYEQNSVNLFTKFYLYCTKSGVSTRSFTRCLNPVIRKKSWQASGCREGRGSIVGVKFPEQGNVIRHWDIAFINFNDSGFLSIITLGYGLDDQGFESLEGLGVFLFTIISRPGLGPTRPPIQWLPGALSLGVKRPEREADRSHPSSSEVKNAWGYTSTPQYAFMAWCSVKHRKTFTFTLPYLNLPYLTWIRTWMKMYLLLH